MKLTTDLCPPSADRGRIRRTLSAGTKVRPPATSPTRTDPRQEGRSRAHSQAVRVPATTGSEGVRRESGSTEDRNATRTRALPQREARARQRADLLLAAVRGTKRGSTGAQTETAQEARGTRGTRCTVGHRVDHKLLNAAWILGARGDKAAGEGPHPSDWWIASQSQSGARGSATAVEPAERQYGAQRFTNSPVVLNGGQATPISESLATEPNGDVRTGGESMGDLIRLFDPESYDD